MRLEWIKGGSIVSGLLASACCIGPLFFSLLGLGSVGVAATLEKWRPLFMAVTFGFLGLAFYFTYRKKAVTCEDGSCQVKTAGKARKITLWIVAFLAVAFAFYPKWGPALGIGAAKAPSLQTIRAAQTIELKISGMTCEGCARTVRNALKTVPGVVDAEVSYQQGKALVKLTEVQAIRQRLAKAVEEAGYKVEKFSIWKF